MPATRSCRPVSFTRIRQRLGIGIFERFSDAMRSRGFVKKEVGGYSHWVDLELRSLVEMTVGDKRVGVG